ncbi:adenosylcobinamide-GDP ribazoletransferase [Thaumasiovibrio sp. DFM-14]|uniref:adenosylcobinamide-GDP ribazoletransferase n=1 Tax=Thaumasiovibrio sp. DFM-14 TaxID=3384792 RepID=UPI0039A054ED
MREKLIREWQVYLLALTIFTRLPVPHNVPYSEARKNESYKYAGLVGLLVGVLTGAVFYFGALWWTVDVAVVLSMIASITLSGAFHEDGFADTCDGFGGGFTPERKLEIMKDSRVGAYALLGMIMILLLKFTTLIALDQVVISLVIAHGLSRTMAVSFIHTHSYVQQSDVSKLKVSRSPSAKGDRYTLLIVTIATLLLLPTWSMAIGLVITLLCLRWLLARWLVKQVGGYTGDALGAVQQISEVGCYLFLLGAM